MKIVHYTASLNRTAGGVPFAAAGLALAQSKLGADVEVHGGVDGFGEDDCLIWRDMQLVRTEMRQGAYGLNGEAIRKVLAARPDVVHVHGIWCASSVIGLLAATKGMATMVAPHGMLDPWILQRSQTKKAIHSFFLEKPLLRKAGIHALTQAEACDVQAFLPDSKLKIFTLPNGIELTPSSRGDERDGVLFLGRIHEKKQVAELVQMWGNEPALATTILRIAGGGAPDYCRRIQVLAGRFSNVEYLGPVYGKAKEQLLARSTWFILPSQSEGLPMAVLEAIGAGCIPIITPECNLATLVAQGCAFHMHMDFSDFPEIAQKISAMKPKCMAKLSNRAREVARDFAWPRIAADMLTCYEQLLTTPAGK